MAANVQYASPTADAQYAHKLGDLSVNGILNTVVERANGWSIALTLFLVLVAYDQCALPIFLNTLNVTETKHC